VKIRVEVDVKPTELREFLGLPDVSGIQKDALDALSRSLKRGSSSVDPVSILKGFLPAGLLSPDEWQRLLLKAVEAGEAVTIKRGGAASKTKSRARRKSAG
jgi:hypothetical protein